MATPYTTSCGIALTSIDGVDCIGDSRGFINNNIQNLGNAICSVSGFNVQDSNTIDLIWQNSTRTLSADVKPDSIRYSNLASWQALSASPTLSAEAVQQRVAKAWVRFDGTTTVPNITASFNVVSVTKNATGSFTINFTPDTFKNTNYIGAFSCDNWPIVIGGANVINYTPSYDSSNTTVTFQQINSYKILMRSALVVGDSISPVNAPSTYAVFYSLDQ